MSILSICKLITSRGAFSSESSPRNGTGFILQKPVFKTYNACLMQNRTTGLRIRMVRFPSVAFMMPTKISFFLVFLLITYCRYIYIS